MAVYRFYKGIEEFYNIDQEINVSMILVFLFVAQRGVCTQKDIETGLSRANVTISRIVSWWCEQKAYGIDGAGLIQRTEDPKDRRYKMISLTPAGQEFYARIRTTMQSHADGRLDEMLSSP